MGEQKNIVIINGKTYDAASGAQINDTKAAPALVSDFVSFPTLPKLKSVDTKKSARSTKHLVHHKPQRSVTLKRSPVKKKTSSLASARSLPISAARTITVESDQSLLTNSERQERAKQINQSAAISRFNLSAEPEEPQVAQRHQPLPVKPAPQEQISYHHAMPVADFSSNTQSSTDMFDTILSQAESHKQAPIKLSKRKHRLAKRLGVSARAANAIAAVFAIVVIGGFVVYQNVPNISMHMATAQSGVAGAALPSYRPSGFSLSRHVAAVPGQVVLTFQSNSDNRAFTITQATSNWNSQTLSDSYLTGKQVQRYDQPDGKTVYIYDDSNATWVDGGIWYRIEGNSSLSTSQLLKLADSF